MSNENPIFHGHNSPSEINADIRNKRSTKSSSILDPVISPSAAALEQKNFEDPYKLVSQPTWLHESLFGPILSLSNKLPVRFKNIVQSLIDKAVKIFLLSCIITTRTKFCL